MSPNRKRKREIQDHSFDVGCGLGLKRQRKNAFYSSFSKKVIIAENTPLIHMKNSDMHTSIFINVYKFKYIVQAVK